MIVDSVKSCVTTELLEVIL